MTDLEMTKLCAQSMGYQETINADPRAPKPKPPSILYSTGGSGLELFNPLADDAHAMALVKAHTLDVTWGMGEQRWRVGLWGIVERSKDAFIPMAPKQGLLCEVRGYDLNRCIVESVAHLQAGGELDVPA